MTKVVFFDVDGVLLDTVAAKGEAFVEAFADYPEFASEILSIHLSNGGVPRDRKVALMFEHVTSRPPTSKEVEERVARFADAVIGRVLASNEIPGASVALRDLADDYILHALSATPTPELHQVIESRQWSRYFRSIHGSPSEKSSTLSHLITTHGYEAGDCLMVGDSSEDRSASYDNRVPFILVTGSIEPARNDFAAITDLVSLPALVRTRSRMRA